MNATNETSERKPLDLSKIRVLFRAPDTLDLWGVPYDMRPGQSPRDLWQAPRPVRDAERARCGYKERRDGPREDWIYLGTPGGHDRVEETEPVKSFLARHAADIPHNPYEWTTLERTQARWDDPEAARISGDYRLLPVLGIMNDRAVVATRVDGTGGVQAWITATGAQHEDGFPPSIVEEARAWIGTWKEQT